MGTLQGHITTALLICLSLQAVKYTSGIASPRNELKPATKTPDDSSSSSSEEDAITNKPPTTTAAPIPTTEENSSSEEDISLCNGWSGDYTCRNATLKQINDTVSVKKVKNLQMISPPMTKLNKGDFEGFTRLSNLAFFNSSITDIDVDAFEGATMLDDFRLYNGPLTHVPPNVFSKTNISEVQFGDISLTVSANEPFIVSNSLVRLVLNNVSIENYHDEMFERLPELEDLEIIGNGSSQVRLSPNLLRNTSITSLTVKDLQIKIPENGPWLNTNTLEEISLENVNGTNFYADTFQGSPNIQDIEILNEARQDVVISPTAFTHFGIKSLKLRNVSLSVTQPIQSTSLKEIAWINPQISNLQGNFFSGLPNLEKLVIKESTKTVINAPSDLFSRTNITKLTLINVTFGSDLSGEQIKNLALHDYGVSVLTPQFFKNLPNLETLIISEHSRVNITLPVDILDGTRVSALEFRDYITKIPANSPILSSNLLKELTLSRANITHLYVETFESLPDLTKLTLTENSLETLPANIFLKNHRLAYLDISANKFKAFDHKAIFGDDFKVRRVKFNVERNDWDCNCELYPFMTYAIKMWGYLSIGNCVQKGDMFHNWLLALAKLREPCVARLI